MYSRIRSLLSLNKKHSEHKSPIKKADFLASINLQNIYDAAQSVTKMTASAVRDIWSSATLDQKQSIKMMLLSQGVTFLLDNTWLLRAAVLMLMACRIAPVMAAKCVERMKPNATWASYGNNYSFYSMQLPDFDRGCGAENKCRISTYRLKFCVNDTVVFDGDREIWSFPNEVMKPLTQFCWNPEHVWNVLRNYTEEHAGFSELKTILCEKDNYRFCSEDNHYIGVEPFNGYALPELCFLLQKDDNETMLCIEDQYDAYERSLPKGANIGEMFGIIIGIYPAALFLMCLAYKCCTSSRRTVASESQQALFAKSSTVPAEVSANADPDLEPEFHAIPQRAVSRISQ